VTTQSFKGFTAKLEAGFICLLLLYYLGVSLPSPLGKILNAAGYGVMPILIIRHWKRFLYVATKDVLLILLIGLAATSIFWSTAPDFTSNEIKALVRATLIGAYLATRYSLKEQMWLLAWVLGIGAFFSLTLPLAMPSYGGIHDNGAWHGIFPYKNSLACLMTIASILFLFIAFDHRKHRWMALSVLGMAVALIVLSQSKTGYPIFVISLCLLPIYNFAKQQYKFRAFLLLIGLLVGGSAVILAMNNLEFIVVDTLGKDLEFNGRLPLWTLIMNKVFERPWLGYGFAGFWPSDEALFVLNNTWAGGRQEGLRFNAHSGYIDLLLQVGFIGFFLYVLGFILVFLRVLHLLFLNPKLENFWMLQPLVAILLFNLSDTISILSVGTLWSLYVSISLSTALQETRIKKKFQIKEIPIEAS
jgi:exopolysaccharide production protein ExoQ